MKIPSDALHRWVFAKDIADKCSVSREERKANYATFRQFMMYGCGLQQTSDGTYNKIYPHLDQLCALMFSSETTRFTTDVPPWLSDNVYQYVEPISRYVKRKWHDAQIDILFEQALFWSYAYGSMFVKPRWNRGRMETFLVMPHDFGVLREDSMGLKNQEAFVQYYYTTQSEFRNELRDHPRRDEIMKRIIAQPRPTDMSTATADRISLSTSQPIMQGNYNFSLNTINRYIPRVAEDLIQMMELYVWDDDEADYRVFTMADPGEVVYDRLLDTMNVIPKMPPYIQVVPNPAHDYFWGHSEVEKLIPLQELRNLRMEQIKHMMDLQANPPTSFSGFPGINDEIAAAFDSPGGHVVSDMPGAKAEKAAPQVPNDLFMEIREIDTAFEEMSGITGVMQGRGEMGVRSDAHANRLANFGASRAKKRALVIEDSLDELATRVLEFGRRFDGKHELKGNDGTKFILAQVEADVTMKVDAHSNSPIFVNDQRQVAGDLFKVGAIDRESLIYMYDPPQPDYLVQRLKTQIIPKEQAAAAQQAQAQAAEAAAKGPPGKVSQLPPRAGAG